MADVEEFDTGSGKVRIVGLSTLTRTMKKAGVDMADMKTANERAASIVVAAAEALAPRRTGRLAGTIRAAKAVGRARVMGGRASVPYGPPIHWGWPARHIKANPFISTAAQQTESEWLAVYLADIEKIVGEVTAS